MAAKQEEIQPANPAARRKVALVAAAIFLAERYFQHLHPRVHRRDPGG
ncbi:MAG: hypothetical protein JSV41_09275 [Gemmatimonadota bacterium]|nr:MAG: hypothetical protein JSV41_09275 [Gemmatimonadota bacterium]